MQTPSQPTRRVHAGQCPLLDGEYLADSHARIFDGQREELPVVSPEWLAQAGADDPGEPCLWAEVVIWVVLVGLVFAVAALVVNFRPFY